MSEEIKKPVTSDGKSDKERDAMFKKMGEDMLKALNETPRDEQY